MSGAQHSSESVEHYTPEWIVTLARETLDRITLDPATNMFANKLVQAKAWYTEKDDGLVRPWHNGTCAETGAPFPARVFCNPPGKVPGKQGGQALWWAKACTEVILGNAACVVFVSFSVELLQTAQQQTAAHPLDYTVLFPSKRVAYDVHVCDKIAGLRKLATKRMREGKYEAAAKLEREAESLAARFEAEGEFRVAGDSPPHSSMIVCVSWCQARLPFDPKHEGYQTRFARLAARYGYVHNANKCPAC